MRALIWTITASLTTALPNQDDVNIPVGCDPEQPTCSPTPEPFQALTGSNLLQAKQLLYVSGPSDDGPNETLLSMAQSAYEAQRELGSSLDGLVDETYPALESEEEYAEDFPKDDDDTKAKANASKPGAGKVVKTSTTSNGANTTKAKVTTTAESTDAKAPSIADLAALLKSLDTDDSNSLSIKEIRAAVGAHIISKHQRDKAVKVMESFGVSQEDMAMLSDTDFALIVGEIFGMVDKDGDGELTQDEISSIDTDSIHKALESLLTTTTTKARITTTKADADELLKKQRLKQMKDQAEREAEEKRKEQERLGQETAAKMEEAREEAERKAKAEAKDKLDKAAKAAAEEKRKEKMDQANEQLEAAKARMDESAARRKELEEALKAAHANATNQKSKLESDLAKMKEARTRLQESTGKSEDLLKQLNEANEMARKLAEEYKRLEQSAVERKQNMSKALEDEAATNKELDFAKHDTQAAGSEVKDAEHKVERNNSVRLAVPILVMVAAVLAWSC